MQDIPSPDLHERVPPTRIQLHGVLVRVLDVGILLIGESAIGKSECALELVSKGYQLVADDVVEVEVTSETLVGKAPELTSELLEIRGLGIINVRELFGEHAVCGAAVIDICVELQKWSEVERIGDVVGQYAIADRTIPKFTLPVSPGRNLSTLVETAARLHLNRSTSVDAGKLLLEKHAALLNSVG